MRSLCAHAPRAPSRNRALQFPGYVLDYPYREQSAPWFGMQKVARGGCFATPDLLLRGEYRSFYHATDRPELAIGFRTCAL